MNRLFLQVVSYTEGDYNFYANWEDNGHVHYEVESKFSNYKKTGELDDVDSHRFIGSISEADIESMERDNFLDETLICDALNFHMLYTNNMSFNTVNWEEGAKPDGIENVLYALSICDDSFNRYNQ